MKLHMIKFFACRRMLAYLARCRSRYSLKRDLGFCEVCTLHNRTSIAFAVAKTELQALCSTLFRASWIDLSIEFICVEIAWTSITYARQAATCKHFGYQLDICQISWLITIKCYSNLCVHICAAVCATSNLALKRATKDRLENSQNCKCWLKKAARQV